MALDKTSVAIVSAAQTNPAATESQGGGPAMGLPQVITLEALATAMETDPVDPGDDDDDPETDPNA